MALTILPYIAAAAAAAVFALTTGMSSDAQTRSEAAASNRD